MTSGRVGQRRCSTCYADSGFLDLPQFDTMSSEMITQIVPKQFFNNSQTIFWCNCFEFGNFRV